MPLMYDDLGWSPPPWTGPDKVGRGAEPSDGTFRGRLDIGLVNNMPSGAFRATERQFARLLAAASGPIDVHLHLFALAEVPRDAVASAWLAKRYGDFARLEDAHLDALIVTGAEPIASSLADEPYWPAMTRVVDWAERNTVSTIWSCLAAHAAVLHLDGIPRRRLSSKRFGLFEGVKVAADGLLDGAPASLRTPHSRWNDLSESELRSHGYRIVARGPEAGVESFTKAWGSLFVFLQGHPEYDPDTLFREYRRDVQRYCAGARDGMPEMPMHYFDGATERRAAGFAELTGAHRVAAAWDAFEADWRLRPAQTELWRTSSTCLFRNWLDLVGASQR